jgi:hypothetical protein
MEALAGFTAFINPNSGGTFNSDDWVELMTSPSDLYTDKIREVFTLTGDYVIGGANNPVIYWWLGSETSEDIVDVSTHDTRVVTSYNPFRTDTMYFGNYSQCHDSGFAACP